jgi:molybdenum cofactor cytidylyltransferase
MSNQPTIVVLAAGAGSRFDGSGHKLEQPLGEGSVIGQTLRNVLAARMPVVVVTTPRLADAVARLVASRDVIVLPEVGTAGSLPLGMGYSISTGVTARPDAAGWLILPGDMPLVQPATLRAVGEALAEHPVVVAQHRGLRGHPVGFSPELYSELAGLTGDDGARRVVARYPAFGLEVDDAGVLADIDTPDDLKAVRERSAAILATGAAQPPRAANAAKAPKAPQAAGRR